MKTCGLGEVFQTWALLLGLLRGIGRAVRERTWDNRMSIRHATWELSGRTLGIVGMGGTGLEVARRASGFEMEIIAVDPEAVASPSFVKSTFANRCSQLMTPSLDPEKQLNKINEPLSEYTSQYRNHFIGSRKDYVAIDIGRDHRIKKGITKQVIDGQSFWETSNS